MPDSKLSISADADGAGAFDCEGLVASEGSESPDVVLIGLCKARQQGRDANVTDISRMTGLSLRATFDVLRDLEFARMIAIEDDPSDPFGARLHLLDKAFLRLHSLRTA